MLTQIELDTSSIIDFADFDSFLSLVSAHIAALVSNKCLITYTP